MKKFKIQEEVKPVSQMVSIREYARLRGVGDKTIAYHIKKGRFDGCIDYSNKARPKINVALADQMAMKFIDPSYVHQTSLLKSATQAVNGGAGNNRAQTPPQNTRDEDIDDLPPMAPVGTTGRSMAQIKILDAELALQHKAMKFAKEKGTLVDKKQVYDALFEFGREIRSELEAMPDRIIDDLRAAQSRNEAHEILSNAVSTILNNLAGIQSRDITQRS